MKKFRHKTEMKCLKCGSIFWSRFEGEFSVCDCWNYGTTGGCAIDETEHYCRFIGSNFVTKNTKGEWHDPIKAMAESKKD